jgi:hypothetical protein
MEIFLVWFGLSCIAGYVGGNKGHSGFAFFLLSLIFSPLIGLTSALVAKDLTKEPAPSEKTHLKCPDCAELVLKEAKVCKHCHAKLVPQE